MTPRPDPRGPALDRRTFGTAAVVLAGGALAGPLLASCAETEDPAPDALLPLLAAAERDAEELSTAAPGTHGRDAERLRTVAAARSVHARTLRAEVDRLAATGTTSSSAVTTPAASPVTCPPVAEVRDRLVTDAAAAGRVAGSSQGYRAALAASVAASCTAAAEVALA